MLLILLSFALLFYVNTLIPLSEGRTNIEATKKVQTRHTLTQACNSLKHLMGKHALVECGSNRCLVRSLFLLFEVAVRVRELSK